VTVADGAPTGPHPRRRTTALDVKPGWDQRFGAWARRVLPGAHAVSDQADEMLVTILGSCVAACIRDPVVGVGGMNHFMLPHDSGESQRWPAGSLRYGTFAMERLINDLLARGARRDRLELKLFGGANVIQSSMKVGDANAAFARKFARDEGLKIIGEDLGDIHPRRVHYFAVTGKAMRLLLQRGDDARVFRDEDRMAETLRRQPVAGDVELFD
jgi:chemotaxis protein CheD